MFECDQDQGALELGSDLSEVRDFASIIVGSGVAYRDLARPAAPSFYLAAINDLHPSVEQRVAQTVFDGDLGDCVEASLKKGL
jgi:hypothetical protein